jgi:hypothetical protein
MVLRRENKGRGFRIGSLPLIPSTMEMGNCGTSFLPISVLESESSRVPFIFDFTEKGLGAYLTMYLHMYVWDVRY